MKQHRVLILIIAVTIGAVLSGLLYPFFALHWQISNYESSLQRWRQSQPRHYTYEVTWQDFDRFQSNWQIDIQDGQLVQARDPNTSQSLNPNLLAYAKEFVLIDNLFVRIDESLPPASSIGGYVGRAYPNFVRFLSYHGIEMPRDWACVPPLPKVRYNAQWGYPTYVKSETNPCFATNVARTKVEVTISNFQPLP
jgi:hypothetical protein